MAETPNLFENPFRPGAGHAPPYLAGRKHETEEFRRLLGQSTILENTVLTGLRGVGKTVLMETFKPIAQREGWLWVGTDMSESSSVSEETLANRLLTDLSVVTSSLVILSGEKLPVGFVGESETVETTLGYQALYSIYTNTPGLVSDKLKAVLELVADYLPGQFKGIIFAYDEAQNLSDHAAKEQYPLSLLLDTFQSIQRKNIPFMLFLVGLPTLFPQLVEARTYAERMFHVIFLDRLDRDDSKEAITKPVEDANCPVKFSEPSVETICDQSGGYPYFIQFICREVFDAWIHLSIDDQSPIVPVKEIERKLDSDFFAGRWDRATDRQRALLGVIASLDNSDAEFSVQDIVECSRATLARPFSSSHVNQMLNSLRQAGLIYKNRHGRYSFAVPLLDRFIRRQEVPGLEKPSAR